MSRCGTILKGVILGTAYDDVRDVPCPGGKDRAFIQRIAYAERQNTVWCTERTTDRL